ncbi:MAG TPA: AAA family ATPase [Chloroflexi bacterium]|nr:AAA family ATPase [Chloroflexota bacterium]
MNDISGLNFEQQKAVNAGPGSVLVLAGPGSGKTRVLTQRVTYLISEGLSPHRLLAVTFTNRAAKEMRSRIESQIDPKFQVRNVGTFHSLCARLLRQQSENDARSKDFVIYDSADQRALIKQSMHYHNIDDKRYKPHSIHSTISTAKNDLIGVSEFSRDSYYDEIVARVYERYQHLLQQNNALDFDDLLAEAVFLLRDNSAVREHYQNLYQKILVDEFQDTNLAQYTLLRLLSGQYRDLFVVGDPDQSIYRWRGADYRNVRRFQTDYPEAEIIYLRKNYRSTQTILDVATAVIDKNHSGGSVRLFSDIAGGDKINVHEAYDEEEEAQFVVDTIKANSINEKIRPGECAVMYRTNAQSRALEEAFVRAGMPYRLLGATRFYARREIKDLLAYIRLIHNMLDTVSLERIINVPSRGIGSQTYSALLEYCEKLNVNPIRLILKLTDDGSDAEHYKALGARTARPLAAFGLLLRGWLNALEAGESVGSLLDLIIHDTNYEAFIKSGKESSSDRWENVEELRKVFSGFDDRDLGEVLEQISLVADVDSLGVDLDGGGAPALMTLHAAKGLEFPLIFIVGLNDGVLPHRRSFDEPEEMAEERRLLYVGLTRAKELIYLSHTFRRYNFGYGSSGIPSRFLKDLPMELVTGDVSTKNISDPTDWPQTNVVKSQSVSNITRSSVDIQFRSGQRVSHHTFGLGIVIESKFLSGDELVIVAFDDVGIKRLVAGSAQLKLEDVE